MLDRSLDLVLKQMVGGQRDTTVKTSRATLVAGYTFIEEIGNSKSLCTTFFSFIYLIEV